MMVVFRKEGKTESLWVTAVVSKAGLPHWDAMRCIVVGFLLTRDLLKLYFAKCSISLELANPVVPATR